MVKSSGLWALWLREWSKRLEKDTHLWHSFTVTIASTTECIMASLPLKLHFFSVRREPTPLTISLHHLRAKSLCAELLPPWMSVTVLPSTHCPLEFFSWPTKRGNCRRSCRPICGSEGISSIGTVDASLWVLVSSAAIPSESEHGSKNACDKWIALVVRCSCELCIMGLYH